MSNPYLALLAALCAVTVLIGGCCIPGHKCAQLSLSERLERSPHVEFVIEDHETGNLSPIYIIQPDEVKKVREWIRKHAWPPIDLRTVGAVPPRGYFTVFSDYSASSLSFRIYVFGSTGSPDAIHVSNDDWRNLLSLLPQTR